METLYRKYRPIDFDTVVGQDIIVKTLRNQIVKGSIAHAYLFSGTRGTGKTTVAKIFARSINCPNELNGNPCNECAVCKSALDGADLNIVEMDAASKGGIEDIRRITDQIEYPPVNGEKYKVFIIDEAHALSDGAVQAFLKSLEEPPEYVVYILATTDPNKLPETILSRCQKYNFKRINIETIVEYLKKICTSENIEIDEDALVFIAEKSDGSMRESISKLDRIRAYSANEKFTKEKVLEILGVVDDEDFSEVARAVNESNIEKAFTILNECLEKGKDISQFTNDLIWYLRNLLIVKDLKEPTETLNITKSNFDKLKKESKLISKDTLIYFIEELSKTYNVMKYDENRRVILETSLIRLANPETNYIESAVMARLKNIEDLQKSGSYVRVVDRNEEVENTNKEKSKDNADAKIKEIKLTPATMDEINKVTENWQRITSSVEMTIKPIIQRSKALPGNEKEPGLIEVQTSDKDYNFLMLISDIGKIEESLENVATELIGKKIIFKLVKLNDSKYSSDVKWKLDDAFDKIDIEIGEQND